jgi:hypothetical protein
MFRISIAKSSVLLRKDRIAGQYSPKKWEIVPLLAQIVYLDKVKEKSLFLHPTEMFDNPGGPLSVSSITSRSQKDLNLFFQSIHLSLIHLTSREVKYFCITWNNLPTDWHNSSLLKDSEQTRVRVSSSLTFIYIFAANIYWK